MEEKLKEQVKILENQYQELNKMINETVNYYNDQIRILQSEGQAKVDDLRIKREGTLTSIKSLNAILENDNKEDNSIKLEDEKIVKKEENLRKARSKKETSSKLTQDEITNISAIITSDKKTNSLTNDKVVSSSKDETIPDYLRDEYKSMYNNS